MPLMITMADAHRSSHMSSLTQLWLDCPVALHHVHRGSNHNPSGRWNVAPARKQCDLEHWVPHGHMIDGKLVSAWASPLNTQDVTKAMLY